MDEEDPRQISEKKRHKRKKEGEASGSVTQKCSSILHTKAIEFVAASADDK